MVDISDPKAPGPATAESLLSLPEKNRRRVKAYLNSPFPSGGLRGGEYSDELAYIATQLWAIRQALEKIVSDQQAPGDEA